jgi:hypothetical protein
MEDKDTEGTILSKLKPVVTMLTDTLVRDFCPAYKLYPLSIGDEHSPLFERTDEAGEIQVVTEEQLRKDVEAWLLDLESQMENESDRAYAKIVTHMIRKNRGWVDLLTNRVKRRLENS